MRWMPSRVAESFHEKCVWASTMPGISVAPAPSITVAPTVGIDARAAADAQDAVALDQHVAGEGRRARAVDDPHVGEEHVRHVCLLHRRRA